MVDCEKMQSDNLKEKFIIEFKDILNKTIIQKGKVEIDFLCVGTDKIIGDSFGPLVGSKLNELLQKFNFCNVNVYGTLQENLNYESLEKVIKNINSNSTIVVIDAALSNKENIGKIFISNRKTILGKGLDKNKIEIGDISIKSVVAKDYKIPKYNFKALQNISLNGIIILSTAVAEGIYEVLKSY